MLNRAKDLNDLSAEISAVSMIITGLSNGLDEEQDHLTTESLKLALFGVAQYLDRIAADLGEFQKQ